MKKLLLLALLAIGGVCTVNADVELYLHNSNNDWAAYPAFENKGTNPSNSSETIYEYVLNCSTGLGTGDFFFRLKWSDYTDDLRPYGGSDYAFVFNDGIKEHTGGQWETYTINHSDGNFWGSTGAFQIKQSTIKANEYKITVYANRGNSYHVKVEIVDMPATVSSLGFSTFSCDRALDLDNASTGLTVYKASVNDGKVVLTKATGKVAAGTGLLLAGTTGTIPVVATAEGTDISSSNLLKGNLSELTIAASTDGAYHYFLAGTDAASLGFYNLETEATCAAGKAYLETTTALTNESGSNSRVAWIFADDNATAIEQIATSARANEVYDLQGRRVAQPTKGLYIVNGKKVIK